MFNPDRTAEIEAELKLLESHAPEEDVPASDAIPPVPPVEKPAETTVPPKEDKPEETAQEDVSKLKELVERYKQRAEKRDKDLERGLHSTLAEKKKLEEDKKALESEIAALKASKIAPDPIVDEEEDDFPEVSQRIKPVLGEVERLKLELAELRKQQEANRKRAEEEEAMAYATKHFNAVREKHPDAALFLADDSSELRLALLEWVQDKEPEYAEAATDALGKSPAFVARVLTEFKRDIGLDKKVESPSLGDLAVKPGAPAKPAPVKNEDTDVFTAEELENVSNLLYINRNKPEVLAALEKKLDRTFKSMGG